ncbi:MAG: sel1 repeat family protein [Acidaminococcus sp.]|nr:sel1 repeat family protein [Acidaminococcus sp.]MCI2100718.1 sel1 repeat family protein [Acidaminococcus sp.]MCI2115039.1 sel1 repeat family protein [Acidaminococcus sp.]MCI2117115.1 sel1 repeat family protein [Acidaminococcus sp.]
MDNQLAIVDADVFTAEEQSALSQEIDRIIHVHKNNRQAINRLVFECTAALTEADDASRRLENKGFFRRLIGGISGSNRRLQDKINSNMRAAQYASQVTLQKLAEQNLMTFDLLTAVNNKLNASVEATNEMVKKQFMVMGKFFQKNRSDIVSLNLRMNAVERNVKLLNWQNSIEYLDFNGVEYSALDDVEKIVCLTRDFYDLTEGKWSMSDLLLLKAAMGQVGIEPHKEVNYFQTMKAIADTPVLEQKLLGNQTIKPISDPSYLISLGTLNKLDALENEEEYLVDTMVSIFSNQGIKVAPQDIKYILTEKYMKQYAGVNLNSDIETYDLLLDLLFNLSEGKTEKLLHTPDDNLPQLFLINHSPETFETIHEAADAGNAKALYMLGSYYNSGYEVVKINEKLGKEYVKKSCEAGYPVTGFNIAYDLPENSSERVAILNAVKADIADLAKEGDFFAQNALGNMYGDGIGVTQDDLEASRWYRKAAEQGYADAQNNLGVCYRDGQGVEQSDEKAAEWFSKAAEQGFADAQTNLGVCYQNGQGVEQSDEKAVEWYRKAAEQGYADAQTILGVKYEYGWGVERSAEKAVEWYRKAAEQGFARAQTNLGVMYKFGLGVERSAEKAVEWYRRAAEQGYADAQTNLGFMYKYGWGVERSAEKAVEWYRKAAEQGNAAGQYWLADCYKYGQGVEQSLEKAKIWYQKAAEQGDADAQNSLGKCYQEGLGVKQSYEKAVEWFSKAAEQGDADAQNSLGKCYQEGLGVEQSYEKAVEWFSKAAEQGKADAQNSLGKCYQEGLGVEQSYEKAVEWYRKAAEGGYEDALNSLGKCYQEGLGVEKSYEKAVEWYRMAAEWGFAEAQTNLGDMYKYGRGVEQSDEKAVEWYRKAAEQGFAEAQNKLGDCYLEGRGVKQSYEKAVEWYQKAAEQGFADAQYNLGNCYLEGRGVEQSDERAVEWYQKAGCGARSIVMKMGFSRELLKDF